jgi:hypothetical protein
VMGCCGCWASKGCDPGYMGKLNDCRAKDGGVPLRGGFELIPDSLICTAVLTDVGVMASAFR